MRPFAALLPLLVLSLLTGCPKEGEVASSGSTEPASWVVFEVYEAGTGNPLSATVWPKDSPDHFETVVQGEAGSSVRFEGLGRTGAGWVLPFSAGSKVTLLIWSPGHELKRVEAKLKRGENLLSVELKRTEIEDDQVPEKIRLKVLELLPSEGPKSGS